MPEIHSLMVIRPPRPRLDSTRVEDPKAKFRIVPENFKYLDFKNRSYGRYKYSTGKTINLTLEDGKRLNDHEEESGGWFDLSDVYYTDLTGDGIPEAIVLLWHVQCGGSCDGGAALFYIYTIQGGKLKEIWQYETGTLAYGCGLKSFSVMNRRLVMETFGACWQPASSYPGSAKFLVDDLTRSKFQFNGRRFVNRENEFISVPTRDVRNYEPEIRLHE